MRKKKKLDKNVITISEEHLIHDETNINITIRHPEGNEEMNQEVLKLRKEIKRLNRVLAASQKRQQCHLREITKLKAIIIKYKIDKLSEKQKLVVRTMIKKI